MTYPRSRLAARLRPRLTGLALALAMAIQLPMPSTSRAAEFITLSPENYENAAPKGKEADAIWGDVVLRNNILTAVIADPNMQPGRSGGRMGRQIPGRLVDLELRDAANDSLIIAVPTYYQPDHRSSPCPDGMLIEPHRQGEFILQKDRYKAPGREPKTDKRVEFKIPYIKGVTDVTYALEDDKPYLEIKVVYPKADPKAKTEPIPITFALRTTGGYPSIILQNQVAWVYDRWFDSAYAVVLEDRKFTPTSGRGLDGLSGPWSIENLLLSKDSQTIVQYKLIPAKNSFDAVATAMDILKVPSRKVDIQAKDPKGPVADAFVEAFDGNRRFAAGKTDAQGKLSVRLPDGEFKLNVKPLDRPAVTLKTNETGIQSLAFDFPESAMLAVEIKASDNQPTPCRIRVFGANGTPDPTFFTPDGDERAGNVLQPINGKITQPLPIGTYRVVITRGPEYDALIQEITVEPGKTVSINGTLKRSVNTAGWVAAELANHTTKSVDSGNATTTGRILALVGETIEFAPATERHFASSFTPAINEVGAQKLIATESGVHLRHPVRKAFTSQNAFPITPVPGDQDGGMPQRPQHVLQVWWLSNYPYTTNARGDIVQTGGNNKLIQVTPPGIWVNDGRTDGMINLFDLRRVDGHEVVNRGARLRELANYDAMELQPLHAFLNVPDYDPADPKGQKDLDAWYADFDNRSAAGRPHVPNRNRDWLRMLNLGFRFTGVANNSLLGYADRANNVDDIGHWRTWIHTGQDDPAKLTTDMIIQAIRAGRTIMSNGPFLQVDVSSDGKTAGPGQDILATKGKAQIKINVQCPDWFDIDQVVVLYNGAKAHTFTRQTKDSGFSATSGPVRFSKTIDAEFQADTNIVVIASGIRNDPRKSDALGPPVRGKPAPKPDTTTHYIAMNNPVFVDINGDGFKPHSPTKDRVFTRFIADTVPVANTPMDVKLELKNLADKPAKDAMKLEVLPEGAAKIELVSGSWDYELEPGKGTTLSLIVTPTGTSPRFKILVPRSTEGVGRRAVGRNFAIGQKPRTPEDPFWLEHQAPDLPGNDKYYTPETED